MKTEAELQEEFDSTDFNESLPNISTMKTVWKQNTTALGTVINKIIFLK